MKLLHRYIGINIISTILLVTFVLVSLEVFILFSGEFTDIGTGNYNTWHALAYVMMTLPMGIYQFFPIAGLLGSLIGLGMLASRSELIVMRTSGVSILQITSIVLQAALIIMILAVLLGEVFGPSLQRDAAKYKNQAISGGQTLTTNEGLWLHQNKAFIRIAHILPNKELKNITRYQFDANDNLIYAAFAKQGRYTDGHWLFTDVTTSSFGENKLTQQRLKQQIWKLKLGPHILRILRIDPSARSIPQLYSFIKYLHYSGLQANKYEFVFWQRLMQPLATLVMILLAIPFIFGPLRTVTMGLRILIGTVVGLTYFILNQFLGPITQVFQLPPLLVAIVPTMLMAVLGFILLLRVR